MNSDVEQLGKLFSKWDSIPCRIISGSMEPVLKKGDRICIKKVSDLTQLKIFDVIVFKQGSSLICHFVWQINQVIERKTVVTRSLVDPLANDLPTHFGNILGRVVDVRIPFFIRIKILILNLMKNTS